MLYFPSLAFLNIAVTANFNTPLPAQMPYALYDENKLYTRNLVHLNEHYALIVLRWNPAKESPIHDHPCDGCWLKVLEGNIEETIYTKDEVHDAIVEVSHSRYGCGSLTFMHGECCLQNFHVLIGA